MYFRILCNFHEFIVVCMARSDAALEIMRAIAIAVDLKKSAFSLTAFIRYETVSLRPEMRRCDALRSCTWRRANARFGTLPSGHTCLIMDASRIVEVTGLGEFHHIKMLNPYLKSRSDFFPKAGCFDLEKEVWMRYSAALLSPGSIKLVEGMTSRLRTPTVLRSAACGVARPSIIRRKMPLSPHRFQRLYSVL